MAGRWRKATLNADRCTRFVRKNDNYWDFDEKFPDSRLPYADKVEDFRSPAIMAMWSGVALTLVVYCLNMVGDALRDLLDPRLRGGGSLAGGVGARAAERARKALQKLERSR